MDNSQIWAEHGARKHHYALATGSVAQSQSKYNMAKYGGAVYNAGNNINNQHQGFGSDDVELYMREMEQKQLNDDVAVQRSLK